MGKHTPGPWEMGATDGVGYVQIKKAPYTGEGEEMALAAPQNARLIAAAPELLSACEVAIGECRRWNGNPDVAEFIHAAIRKATGED